MSVSRPSELIDWSVTGSVFQVTWTAVRSHGSLCCPRAGASSPPGPSGGPAHSLPASSHQPHGQCDAPQSLSRPVSLHPIHSESVSSPHSGPEPHVTPRGVPSPSSLVPVLPTLLALQPRTRQAVSLLGSASLCPRPEVPSPEASGTSFPALLKSLWKLHLLRRASRAPRPLAGSGPQHLCTYYATYYLSCLLVKDFFLLFLIYSRCLRRCLSRGYSNALPNELRVPLDAHCSQDLKVCLEFVDCLHGPHLLSYMNSLQFALNANVCYVYDCTWPGQASDVMVPGPRGGRRPRGAGVRVGGDSAARSLCSRSLLMCPLQTRFL